jgi:hypothetical protein
MDSGKMEERDRGAGDVEVERGDVGDAGGREPREGRMRRRVGVVVDGDGDGRGSSIGS